MNKQPPTPQSPGQPIACAECGTFFTPLAYNSKFCSLTCKRRGEYRRAKARGDTRRAAAQAERTISDAARVGSHQNALPEGSGSATNSAVADFLSAPPCKHEWLRDPSDGTFLCRRCAIRRNERE